MNSTPVAFFDFDGTLTRRDTLLPFLRYVAGGAAFHTRLALLSPVLLAYLTGGLRNDVAKEIVLRSYLGGQELEELRRKGREFSQTMIPAMLRPEGMERLHWHQAQGHDCVLVSASLDVYLQPWTKTEKFSDLISTSLNAAAGKTDGRICGRNCHGREKVQRMKAWLSGRSPAETYAYGDSRADIHMLEHCGHGYLLTRSGFRELKAN